MSVKPLDYSFRPYKSGDLKAIELLEDEREVIEAHEEFFAALADKNRERKTCITTMYKEHILFIVGYYEVEPGVAQVFVIPSKLIFKHPLPFIKMVRHWRVWLEETQWCRRIQTVSLPTKLIDKWMTKLGFACEAKLIGYTEGRDYNLWGREKHNGIWGRLQTRVSSSKPA